MFRPGPAWRALFYLFAASFWSFQWVLGSRAVWAGFAIAVLAVCLFARSGRLKWLRQQGLLVLLGGLMSLWFQVPGTTHIPSSYSVAQRGNSSVSERSVLVQSAIEMIKESPWTGVGPGQFGMNYSVTRHAHPHNAPLQWVSEYGLISGMAAIALLVMLLGFGLRKLHQTTRENADAVQMSLVAALVMGSVDSMFSGNLTMPHSQVLFFVLAGWIIGRNLPEHPSAAIPGSEIARTMVAGAIVLASLITLVLALEYLDVVENVRGAAVVRIPSFWQSGRFEAW